jgi:hypothetical protein
MHEILSVAIRQRKEIKTDTNKTGKSSNNK